jgi:hypothetical protein
MWAALLITKIFSNVVEYFTEDLVFLIFITIVINSINILTRKVDSLN